MMRGRVMALYIMCFMGGTPIGAPLIGWLAETLGPRWGLIGGGAVCLLATVGISYSIGRRHGLTPTYVSGRIARALH
jgi:MFS family permease